MSVDSPIGIIDSGVGGLTVVKEMLKVLPHEPIIYIGDTARCPYGPRPADEVMRFTEEMTEKLAGMHIKMLVIACNTATAVALDAMRKKYNFPIIGVIVPGARAAVKASASGRIAVLGTAGTINSKAYENAIHAINADSIIYPLACPAFVPIVEKGEYKSAKANGVVKESLEPLMDKEFDAAILGCTHYPLLQYHIGSHLPDKVHIISSAVETVRDVQAALQQAQITSTSSEPARPLFYSTGEVKDFKAIVKDWLSLPDPDVRHIDL